MRTLNSIGRFPDAWKHHACSFSSNVNANPLSQLRFFAPSPRINSVLPNPMSHFMTATADLRAHTLRAFGFASQVHFPWHPQDFLHAGKDARCCAYVFARVASCPHFVSPIRTRRWRPIQTKKVSFESKLSRILFSFVLRAKSVRDHSIIVATAPEPTVCPPSRIAKRRPCSIATLWISSTVISTLSPGMHISVPAGSSQTPVTSVVLK